VGGVQYVTASIAFLSNFNNQGILSNLIWAEMRGRGTEARGLMNGEIHVSCKMAKCAKFLIHCDV
jgi:hypothetical protein